MNTPTNESPKVTDFSDYLAKGFNEPKGSPGDASIFIGTWTIHCLLCVCVCMCM